MNNIVPDCLCIAIHKELTNPQQCVAVRRIAKGERITIPQSSETLIAAQALWEVDRNLDHVGPVWNLPLCPEAKLYRIDNYQPGEVKESELEYC